MQNSFGKLDPVVEKLFLKSPCHEIFIIFVPWFIFSSFSLFYLHPINRLSCLIFLRLNKNFSLKNFTMKEKVESFFENIFRWFIITLHTVREISNTLFGIYMKFIRFSYGVLLISFKRFWYVWHIEMVQ